MDTESVLIEVLSERVIAFHVAFKRITKNTNAALLLSQLLYWFKKVNFREFFKTDREIMSETEMTQEELKHAKKHLRKLGLINVKIKGSPPRCYYTLDINRLIDEYKKSIQINNLVKSHKSICGFPTNRFVGKPQIESAKNACISVGYTQDNTIDYNNRLLQEKDLSPEERETQNFGKKKEKEKLLRDLGKYVEPERLKRIEKIPFKQLDILLFLLEESRINLNQIQDLYAYAKSLNEPEDFIPYTERRRIEQQLKKQKEEERRRRSASPEEEMVSQEEIKASLARIFHLR
ncbi:hypothetical protein [Thermodesulfovibrio sp.]|uniref:hypothetical protein n=1 Tax=Thermodesulfovibrio sp. TaxID=2067987 RepID=UPI00309906E9